ncbi:hypothetical protein PR048_027435 [Dryococelus australis]|uniref:Adenylate cyclase N-terminal domain-containing protein n=1 Tax=Dryococelus australis TaxID=614101 RepID=A0ABQ9GFF9_9NEOP|nr:hypothetical protein PR048_027435 [Dryococelus australis]
MSMFWGSVVSKELAVCLAFIRSEAVCCLPYNPLVSAFGHRSGRHTFTSFKVKPDVSHLYSYRCRDTVFYWSLLSLNAILLVKTSPAFPYWLAANQWSAEFTVSQPNVLCTLSLTALPSIGLSLGGEEESRPLTLMRPLARPKPKPGTSAHPRPLYHLGSEALALGNQACGLAGVLSIPLVPLQGTAGAGCRSPPGLSKRVGISPDLLQHMESTTAAVTQCNLKGQGRNSLLASARGCWRAAGSVAMLCAGAVFKRGFVYKGIYCPSLTSSFRENHLELAYQRYSHRQRQKSLIVVNVVDSLLKVVLGESFISSSGRVTSPILPGVCNTGYSLEPQPMNTQLRLERVYTGLWSLAYRDRDGIECSPSTKANPGSIPGGLSPGFSLVGIVPDDPAGRRVFSGISLRSLRRSSVVYRMCRSQEWCCIHAVLCAGVVWALDKGLEEVPSGEELAWTACSMAANITMCVLGWWRCFANNYLHWAAICTWFLLNAQGATVAERSDCSPHAKANRVQSTGRFTSDFRKWNSTGLCRWSTGFLGDLPFPRPVHSGAAPFSPHFTSQAIKTPISVLCAVLNSCSHVTGFVGSGIGFTYQYQVWYVLFIVFVTYAMLPLPLRWCMILGIATALIHIIISVVNMYISQVVSAAPYTGQSNCSACTGIVHAGMMHGGISLWSEAETRNKTTTPRSVQGAAVPERLACSPPTAANRVSIPGGVAPGVLHVGIGPGDAAGRRVFSVIARSLALSFRRRSTLTSLYPHGLSILCNMSSACDTATERINDLRTNLYQPIANSTLYIAVNFAGMYTKYLTDRGQRKAFLETHRSMETRCRTQRENDRQEKLLLSG